MEFHKEKWKHIDAETIAANRYVFEFQKIKWLTTAKLVYNAFRFN